MLLGLSIGATLFVILLAISGVMETVSGSRTTPHQYIGMGVLSFFLGAMISDGLENIIERVVKNYFKH